MHVRPGPCDSPAVIIRRTDMARKLTVTPQRAAERWVVAPRRDY